MKSPRKTTRSGAHSARSRWAAKYPVSKCWQVAVARRSCAGSTPVGATRPIGLVQSPARNRKNEGPVTSTTTCRLCASSARATTSPDVTLDANDSSSAISHVHRDIVGVECRPVRVGETGPRHGGSLVGIAGAHAEREWVGATPRGLGRPKTGVTDSLAEGAIPSTAADHRYIGEVSQVDGVRMSDVHEGKTLLSRPGHARRVYKTAKSLEMTHTTFTFFRV